MIGFFSGTSADTGRAMGLNSVVTGIVKENWDDKHQGMVKVEYSLGEAGKNISGWMPVMSLYAGKEFGIYILPEVGAEVIIAFQLGNRNCPIVIGSLWNKTNTVPAETANKDNSVKLIRTQAGCMIRFSEEKGKEKIEIQTQGELKVTLDDEKQTAEVTDKDGKNQILLDTKGGQITLSADKKLSFQAGGTEILMMDGNQAALKAGTVKIEAEQSLSVKGQSSKIEGVSMEMKASGTMKVEASGVAQIKGSMLKLN